MIRLFLALTLSACVLAVAPTAYAATETQCPAPDPDSQSTTLDMAGIETPEAAMAFIAKLQAALKDGDKQAIAAVIKYPLNIYDNGKVKETFTTAESVLKGFSALFTPAVRQAILCTKSDADWFVNDQGLMLGNGEVWIDGWGDAAPKAGSPLLVKAINP